MIHIELPLSKSQVNRALIAFAGQSNLLPWLSEHPEITTQGCRDTRLMVEALLKHATGQQSVDFLDAGTPCRLFTAYAAAKFKTPITITGNDSLNQRSISPLVDALTQMGAEIAYLGKTGYTPITIQKGIVQWNNVYISTEVSSQFASALLLIAPLFPNTKEITLTNSSHSHSYIDLTLHLLQEMAINIEEEFIGNTKKISLQGTYKQVSQPVPQPLKLETDWSSAAFFYPLLLGLNDTNSILLKGLDLYSDQGDVHLTALGHLLGIETKEHPKGVVIKRFKSNSIPPIDHNKQNIKVNLKNNPDLVPALVIGWCILGISVVIEGIENLRFKECDRIEALQENLMGLGCKLEQLGDQSRDLWRLDASNRTFPNSLHINAREDHRIAMAFSSLQNWIPTLTFSDVHCVEKSFPKYWEQWKKCTFE